MLKAEVGAGGSGWDDERIAEAVECGASTVYRVRRAFVEDYTGLFGGAQATIPALATPAAPVTPAPATATATATAHPEGWTCGAKTTCGQMESCEEALFYLTQCGVTRLDGDGDGVPCERLCNR